MIPQNSPEESWLSHAAEIRMIISLDTRVNECLVAVGPNNRRDKLLCLRRLAPPLRYVVLLWQLPRRQPWVL